MDLDPLEPVAQQYRNEGYAVTVRPAAEALPVSVPNFRPELLVTRGVEGAVVVVKKNRLELTRDASIIAAADAINALPNWRFDLVIQERTTELDKALFDATEPTTDQVLGMLAAAEELVEKGYLPSACVTAWAGLEAAMRKVRAAEALNGRVKPTELLQTLYVNGIITHEQYDQLRDYFKLRNQVAHGLIPPSIDAQSVQAVTRIARELLQNVQVAA